MGGIAGGVRFMLKVDEGVLISEPFNLFLLQS